MHTAYKGEITVEDADWTLRAERVVVREGEIEFDLWYRNKGDSLEQPFSGVAQLQPEGYYESGPRYLPDEKCEATLYILRKRHDDGDCILQGFWYQNKSGAWRIKGVLEPLTEVTTSAEASVQ